MCAIFAGGPVMLTKHGEGHAPSKSPADASSNLAWSILPFTVNDLRRRGRPFFFGVLFSGQDVLKLPPPPPRKGGSVTTKDEERVHDYTDRAVTRIQATA